MRSALHTALFAAAAAALLLSGCAAPVQDPSVAPKTQLPRVTMTEEMIAGHEFETLDDYGPVYIKANADGTIRAGERPGQNAVPDAHWRVENGMFCLKSPTWWDGDKGQCYEIYATTSINQDGAFQKSMWGKFAGIYAKFRRTR